MTDPGWDPQTAAERLAERHASVLDYVGRVDQAVTTADLFYLIEKGQALINSTERLLELANTLLDDDVRLGASHRDLIEDYLQRVGAQGYRAARALHPQVTTVMSS